MVADVQVGLVEPELVVERTRLRAQRNHRLDLSTVRLCAGPLLPRMTPWMSSLDDGPQLHQVGKRLAWPAQGPRGL